MTYKQTVRLDLIIRDPKLQMREQLDPEVIERYAAIYREAPHEARTGALGALRCVSNGDVTWLVDGWHRCEAARLAGLTEVPCLIVDGNFDMARWEAAGANTAHGLNRSRETIRRAVMVLVDDIVWHEYSNRALAKHAGVSEGMIRQHREASRFFGKPTVGVDSTEQEAGSRSRSSTAISRSSDPPDQGSTAYLRSSETIKPTPTPETRIGLDGKRRPSTRGPANEARRTVPDVAEQMRAQAEATTETWQPPASLDAYRQRLADRAEAIFMAIGKVSNLLAEVGVTSHTGVNEPLFDQMLDADRLAHGDDHDWEVRLAEIAPNLVRLHSRLKERAARKGIADNDDGEVVA